jgi:uncharacterized phage protein (TIGR01671 family)
MRYVYELNIKRDDQISVRVSNGYIGTLQVGDLGEAELMQFTGLLDKNGKEIYEGDIIRVTQKPGKDALTGEDMPQVDAKAKVFFQDGAFQTDFYNSLLRIALPGNWIVEVIGNIYENTELLSS